MTISNRKLILIVEDDIHSLQITKEFLTMENYQVIEAHNGEQALKMLATQTPDLILSDISLPGADGFALVQKIRAQARFVHTPIIILSGYGRPADQKAAFDAGATGHLTKPINIVHLLREIKTALTNTPNIDG